MLQNSCKKDIDTAAQSDDDFWTSSEFSAIIKISATTLKKRLNSNEVPGAVKVGKQWRIHKNTFYKSVNKGDFKDGK